MQVFYFYCTFYQFKDLRIYFSLFYIYKRLALLRTFELNENKISTKILRREHKCNLKDLEIKRRIYLFSSKLVKQKVTLNMMDTQCNSTSPLDIEDIEDLFDLPNSEVSKAGANSSLVVPKVKKRVKKGIIIEDQVKNQIKEDNKDATEECFLPGKSRPFRK